MTQLTLYFAWFGLLLAFNIVINLHRPDLLLPSMALVVGLHFLPIAFAAGFVPSTSSAGAWW